jgi:hypothetical protein
MRVKYNLTATEETGPTETRTRVASSPKFSLFTRSSLLYNVSCDKWGKHDFFFFFFFFLWKKGAALKGDRQGLATQD